MKMINVTKAMGKAALSLAVCGLLWSGKAHADGDIRSINSVQEGQVITASGTTVEFTIALNGHFEMVKTSGSLLDKPQLRMIVNGNIAYATIDGYSNETILGQQRTYLYCYYTVKPGDMAAPLRIYGSEVPAVPYQFIWNGWTVQKIAAPHDTPDWRIDGPQLPGEKTDFNLEQASITLQTLRFDDSFSPTSVAATENNTWRVASDNPIGAAAISFYVWAADPAVVQVGTSSGQPALLVTMPGGSTYVDFPVKGLVSPGATEIYLQRTVDYNNNFTPIGITNYVKRAISVTPPPAPTVRVVMAANGSDNITLPESSTSNTGDFYVELSEPYASNITVQLDSAPIGQSNLSFAVNPFTVTIQAGDLQSPTAKFSVPDGTIQSASAGVTLSPVITDPTAAAYYTRTRDATIYVTNVKPVIQLPLATDVFTATQNAPYNFTWSTSDVAADMASGMQIRWSYGDGSTNEWGQGASGSIAHTYATTGTKTVKITAYDKDGGISDEVEFKVNVVPPVPQPFVWISTNKDVYNETTTNNTGNLTVYLSEAYTSDTWVLVDIDPALQDNIEFSTTNALKIPVGNTNSVTVNFSVRDGTMLSSTAGIILTPVVTNAASAAYFTDLRDKTVFVNNLDPVVVVPQAGNVMLPSVAPYDAIPMGLPYTFDYTISDVVADRASMQVVWRFESGGSTTTTTGASGQVAHTYNSLGDKIVTVYAVDKDGGESATIQFKVTVVPPPPPPSVIIDVPSGTFPEAISPNTEEFTVRLSETFTNDVVVALATTPANSLLNGTIELSTYTVTFKPGETMKTVRFSPRDGTDFSWVTGFQVTPTVTGSGAAVAHFTQMIPGQVIISNVYPVITNPTATDTSTQDIAYEIPQGVPHTFTWTVEDVTADLLSTPQAQAMRIDWNFGDSSTHVAYGGSGSVSHTYDAVGEMIVSMTATDKDGGRDTVYFKIRVRPVKQVVVTPVGPNREASLSLLSGMGYGTVVSENALSWANRNNTYFFKYHPNVVSATIEAIPYKTNPVTGDPYDVTNYGPTGATSLNPTGVIWDSFFFAWLANGEAMDENQRNPFTATQVAVVKLPASTEGSSGTTDVEVQEVQAIFSRELYEEDNMGDINLDGIPDKIAFSILAEIEGGGSDNMDAKTLLAWAQRSLAGFNDDEDYLPVNPNGVGGRFDFRPIPDPNTPEGAVPVNAFTAYREVRGILHDGLNYPGVSDPSGPEDEPRTDPTLADTDHDGLPDGWEYYFYVHARFNGMTGSAYDPTNVGQGIEIPSSAVWVYFQPTVPAESGGDIDNDGLLDIEELVLGTNPIHWDTDGDGMADGWEVVMGLDPCDPDDGLGLTNNPDGDYMAYATVDRQLVTAIRVEADSSITTNMYIAIGADVGETDGQFFTAYHYGDNSDPWAVGLPTELPSDFDVAEVENIEAAIMHYQVLHEFGFDPRTAWTHSVNYRPPYNRFPNWVTGTPNTREFTSRDEYLLMQFMAANRLNGCNGTIPPTPTAWRQYSTNPLTPDSDINLITMQSDGMPDGWELYVSIRPDADLSDPDQRNMTISPWDWRDGANDHPAIALRDGLSNHREFAGTDSSFYYSDANLYNMEGAVGYVSIVRPTGDLNWLNKFWPTNPWDPDTDGDGIRDGAERAFVYLPEGSDEPDNLTYLIQGGGLNPNSKDTDLDGLPDAWELQFAGDLPDAGVYSSMVITNGMDGTFKDAMEDWDYDGLANYQEYWVQAIRAFRYDIPDEGVVGPVTGNIGLPMDATFDPMSLFVLVEEPWDIAQLPWGPLGPQLHVMLPVGPANLYVSTDPRNPDSDFDGMDDYYELYHGLNPILGSGLASSDLIRRAYIVQGMATIDYGVGALGNDWGDYLPMDFVKYPWLAGLSESDPDCDGLLNFEEALLANSSSPMNYNTDPTPLWMTDASNPNSLTFRFYHRFDPFRVPMFFWPYNRIPAYIYNFEMNEGYDTDNDGISDKAEMVASRNSIGSPQDHDDPMRRQAMWFSGENSAASTVTEFNYLRYYSDSQVGDLEDAMRSFTVELWARPEVVNREQVLLERTFLYEPSDLSNTNGIPRRNFRIGITAAGQIYGKFDNAGGNDAFTAEAKVIGQKIEANKWVHVALSNNGRTGELVLYVNGIAQQRLPTTLIPANGVIVNRDYPTLYADGDDDDDDDDGDYVAEVYLVTISGVLVAGAANNNPIPLDTFFWSWAQKWADYDKFYQGWIDEVRIWDGARSAAEIAADYSKRYSWEDLYNNREKIAYQVGSGYTRTEGLGSTLAPALMYHYNFDNLFSAADVSHVATAPRGFNQPEVTINRPTTDYGAEVPWWADAEVRSTVYTDYQYLPWIENGYDHLPLFGGYVSNSVDGVRLLLTGPVIDSVYWTEISAGNLGVENVFPNRCNPYGFGFHHDYGWGLPMAVNDLLPLGDAWAKQVEEMWDCQGPAEVWLEQGVDTDGDGLPDWWEQLHGGDETSLEWDGLYPDGSGITNGERYQRDIAKGATPDNPTGEGGIKQIADTDGDGLPDWWEKIYNLNHNLPDGGKGSDGAGGDPDRDGLSNLAEYLISEVYGFYHLSPQQPKSNPDQAVSDYFLKQGKLILGFMFSDHDFMEDSWEDQYDNAYVNRFVYDPHLDYDQDGWSNWAESRYGSLALRSDPTLSQRTGPNGGLVKEYPVPTIEATINYKGLHSDAPVVIHAFSSPDMNGVPDAVYTIGASDGTVISSGDVTLGNWAPKTITGVLAPGGIQPGSVEFTFTDMTPGNNQGFYKAVVDSYSDPSGKTGNLMGTDGLQWTHPLGTINYVTGEYELDLGWFDGLRLTSAEDRSIVMLPDNVLVGVQYDYAIVSGWPKTLYLRDADQGYIREGENSFFVFLDVNKSGTWDSGEPAGVVTPFVTDINWDRNAISVDLTDKSPEYPRIALTASSSGGGNQGEDSVDSQRVRILRTVVDGSTIFQHYVLDKVIEGRDYVHDGDFIAMGDYGFDWGLFGVASSMPQANIGYSVYIGDELILTNNTLITSFTNSLSMRHEQATLVRPIQGGYVYSSRPTFRWEMPEEYTAFALEIRKGGPSGTLIYESGTQLAPPRDRITGEYVWEAPIHAGDMLPSGNRFSSNTVYAWRVIPLNSKYHLGVPAREGIADTPCGEGTSGRECIPPTACLCAWSSWGIFRLDVNSPMESAGYGQLRVNLKYYGAGTKFSNKVKVEVYRNRGFSGIPEASYTLNASELVYLTEPGVTNVNATLKGLNPSAGPYYVRAFIDSNGNGVRDVWESWGYANYYGVTDTPFDPRPFDVEFAVDNCHGIAQIIIEDADSDQDWFPDIWEYEQANGAANFLEQTVPSSSWSTSYDQTEVNPDLITGAAAAGYFQSMAQFIGMQNSNDGALREMAGLVLGYTAAELDQAEATGQTKDTVFTPAISDLKVDVNSSGVNWTLQVTRPKQVAAGEALVVGALSQANPGIEYELQYNETLSAAGWKTVYSGVVGIDGEPVEIPSVNDPDINPAKGFFRVVLPYINNP